ncbi:MAG TPA: hypothetical protein VH482_36550 [Thermomicrobiales bacterium]
MAPIDPSNNQRRSANGGRSSGDRPLPAPVNRATAVAVAPPSVRAVTVVPNELPPDEELTEAEIRHRKELDDFLLARRAERGDPWPEFLGPLLHAEEVRELVGLASLDDLDELVQQWRILALPTRPGGVVYPAFQFDDDGQPYPTIAEVIELLAPVAVTPYTIASWLMSPNEFLGDATPMHLLRTERDPQRVLTEARYAAAHMEQF